MQNPNNLITVHFPNGKSRTRNAQTTVIPENREYPQPRFKAYQDFYSRVDYSLLKSNELRAKIERQRFDNGNNWDVIIILTAALAIAGVSLYYFIF